MDIDSKNMAEALNKKQLLKKSDLKELEYKVDYLISRLDEVLQKKKTTKKED